MNQLLRVLDGSGFKNVAYALPFVHAVDATRAALSRDFLAIFPHLWWVIGYAFIILFIAILVFGNKMKSDHSRELKNRSSIIAIQRPVILCAPKGTRTPV